MLPPLLADRFVNPDPASRFRVVLHGHRHDGDLALDDSAPDAVDDAVPGRTLIAAVTSVPIRPHLLSRWRVSPSEPPEPWLDLARTLAGVCGAEELAASSVALPSI